MNLIELYDSLIIPENDDNIFNTTPIKEYPNFRIAVDFEGNVVLLLSVSKKVKNLSLKNFRFKYLQIEQNLECKIYENNSFRLQTFTVIRFRCSDRNLQEYFLKISETLIRTIGQNPTQQQVIDSLKRFVEIFKELTNTPTNSINGLWSELFLIESSKNPKKLIDYWHNNPDEKFDFNAGSEKVEVKSSSNFDRKHYFSSEQLNPPVNTRLLIASIFTKQSNNGKSIQDLIENIYLRINNDIELIDKINGIVCQTLGNSIEYTIGIKFDYSIAKQSLRFYDYLKIAKIEKFNIPVEVTEVHFISDLNNIEPVNTIERNYKLFNSL